MVYTKVTIGGVDVSSYTFDYSCEDVTNSIASGKITLDPSFSSIATIQEEMSVTIERGWITQTDYKIFNGIVTNFNKVGYMYELDISNHLWVLAKKTVKKTYDKDIDVSAGKISEIARDLIETYGGLTAEVEDTGTLLLLSKFICKDDTILERLKKLAKIVDYIVKEDPQTGNILFVSKGYISYSKSDITVGLADSIVINIPKWTYDKDSVVNYCKIKGAVQEVETTESGQIGVTSGYSTSIVTLTNEPVSVKVYCGASNPPTTLLTGGEPGTSSSYDYYVDTINKQIIFSSSFTPGASDYVEIRYSTKIKRNVSAKNDLSISKFGRMDKIITVKDTITVDDAREKARAIVSENPFPSASVSLNTIPTNNIYSGMKIRVIDYINNEDKEIVMDKIKFRFPEGFDTYEGGTKFMTLSSGLSTAFQKLKQLEQDQEIDSGLDETVFDFNKEIRSHKYLEIQKSKIYDSFILGHSVNSLLGMGIILDSFESSNSANWSGASVTIDDEGTTVIEKSGSMSVTWAVTSGTVDFVSSQSFGDVSSYTGESSGTPSKGTVGVWLYSPNTTCLTDIKLRFGSGASDYIECSGREYSTVDGYNNFSSLVFGLNSGWNYYLFDLDNPDSVTGTPDWTNCDYTFFELSIDEAATVYMDYLTISKSNYIGLNGLGDRVQNLGTIRLLQEDMMYLEPIIEDKFFDSVNSTCTFDTGTNQISFTSGQIFYSNAVDIGTVVTSVLLNVGEITGTLKYEISIDSKVTWTELTLNSLTSLTGSDGNGVYLRITENASGTASIDNLLNTEGNIITHALELEMIGDNVTIGSTKTNGLKKLVLNRLLKSSPDYTIPTYLKIGIDNGTPSINSTDLDNPVPFTGTEQIDDCEATTGWTASGTNSVSLNTSSYKEGVSSLNIIKSDASSAVVYVSKTTTSLSFTSKTFFTWLYLSADALADMKTTDCLTVRFGSDSSNYYYYTKDAADLSSGWNLIYFTSSTADGTTGSPTIGACDYTYVAIETTNAADTFIAGECMIDDLKLASADDFYLAFDSDPTISETTHISEIRTTIPATYGNGYLINGVSIWNADASKLMLTEDTFTGDSKSDTDVFTIIDRWRYY